MFRSSILEDRFARLSQKNYPFHPMFFSVLVEMGLSKEQIFDVALDSIQKAYENPSYSSFLIMPNEISLSYPPIEEKLIKRFGLRHDSVKSSPLGWLTIKNKFLNVESSIIKKWSEMTNIPTDFLVSLIKITILLCFRASPIYKDDIRFSMMEPNIDHRLLEISISTAKENLGIFWGGKEDGSIYFDTYLDYLFEINLFGYKSKLEPENIPIRLSNLGISEVKQNELMNDFDGIFKELQFLDSIEMYQRAIYAYNLAHMMGKYE